MIIRTALRRSSPSREKNSVDCCIRSMCVSAMAGIVSILCTPYTHTVLHSTFYSARLTVFGFSVCSTRFANQVQFFPPPSTFLQKNLDAEKVYVFVVALGDEWNQQLFR